MTTLGTHRRAGDGRKLYVINHCLDRFRGIFPHLAVNDPRDLRARILQQVEGGREATPLELECIRQSRARLIRNPKPWSYLDKIIISADWVAYVVEQNPDFGPQVVTCYEVEYLKALSRPVVALPPVAADAWEWEWDELPEPDPFEDLLRAWRLGDAIVVKCSGAYCEVTGEPGRVLLRHKGKKWLPATSAYKSRDELEIRVLPEIQRRGNQKERKRVELHRRAQMALQKRKTA